MSKSLPPEVGLTREEVYVEELGEVHHTACYCAGNLLLETLEELHEAWISASPT